MLKLTRYPGQKIIITHEPTGETITVEVASVNREGKVHLQLSAPSSFIIDREEIHLDKLRELEQ